MSAYRSMALAAMAFIVTGCFGSGGPAATQRASGDGSPTPAATPELLDPLWWDDDVNMTQACRLLQPRQLEKRLGMEVTDGTNPFLVTSEDANATLPLKNACQWKEPLFGDWTASELVLVIWSPLESEFIADEWERNEEWRLDLWDVDEVDPGPAEPEYNQFISRAWFDPGTSDAPNSIGLEDGSTVIGAHATLYVEVGGTIWLSLQPSGEAAARPRVLDDTFLLALDAVAALLLIALHGN